MTCISSNDASHSPTHLLLWGGGDWNAFFGEIFVFDLETMEWTNYPQKGQNKPDARFWHSACSLNNKLYIFGGGNKDKGLYNDLYTLDLSPLTNAKRVNPNMVVVTPATPTSAGNVNSPSGGKTSQNNQLQLQNKVLPSSGNNEGGAADYGKQPLLQYQPSPHTPNADLQQQQQQQRTITIKLQYQDELRSLQFPEQLTFNYLIDKLRDEITSNIVAIKYQDDENDTITIRSDECVRTCLRFFKSKNKGIKLIVCGPADSLVQHQTQLTVPRWIKGKLLGEGAYGKVYLGQNLETGEYMAVKQIKYNSNLSEGQIKEIQNEIELMKMLKHDNIVRYLGVEKTNKVLHIFMEFVPGSISSMLQQFTKFHESVVRKYTRQILFGLKYLHDNKILHRDIKGANILVDERGIVKMADFGHSKLLTNDKTAYEKTLARGTPLWMSPETIKGKPGRKADVWSLGCTIIEMLTGLPPWQEMLDKVGHIQQLMYQVAVTKTGPKLPDSITPEARQFLELCFVIDPKHRASVDLLLQEPFVTRPYDLSRDNISSSSAGGSGSGSGSNSSSNQQQQQQQQPQNARITASQAFDSYNTYISDDDAGYDDEDDDDNQLYQEKFDFDDDEHSPAASPKHVNPFAQPQKSTYLESGDFVASNGTPVLPRHSTKQHTPIAAVSMANNSIKQGRKQQQLYAQQQQRAHKYDDDDSDNNDDNEEDDEEQATSDTNTTTSDTDSHASDEEEPIHTPVQVYKSRAADSLSLLSNKLKHIDTINESSPQGKGAGSSSPTNNAHAMATLASASSKGSILKFNAGANNQESLSRKGSMQLDRSPLTPQISKKHSAPSLLAAASSSGSGGKSITIQSPVVTPVVRRANVGNSPILLVKPAANPLQSSEKPIPAQVVAGSSSGVANQADVMSYVKQQKATSKASINALQKKQKKQ